jgi:outer membrane cobalamin receptor
MLMTQDSFRLSQNGRIRMMKQSALALVAVVQTASAAWCCLVSRSAWADDPAFVPTENTEIEEDPLYTSIVVAKRPRPMGEFIRIDKTEIAIRGARNLPDALVLEPNVEVNQSPKAGSTLEIRGFDEKSILLLFEGIPIREVYDGHFDIASLPAFSFDSIELETGVTTVLFGPNSAGGIVSLRAPSTCDNIADISLYGRPFETAAAMNGGRANGCLHIKDVTLWMGMGYEHSDGYPLSDSFVQSETNAQYHEDGGTRDGSDYKRASISFTGKYAPSRNRNIHLFLDAIRSPRGIPPFEGYGYVRYWRFTDYNTLLVGLSGTLGPDDPPESWGFREIKAQVYSHLHRDEIRDYEDATYAHLTTNSLAWFVASAYDNATIGVSTQGAWSLNPGNRLDLTLRYNFDLHKQREIPVPKEDEEMQWTAWERYASHTFNAAVEDTQEIGPVKLNAGFGASGMSLAVEEIRGTSYPINKRVHPGYEGRIAVEYAPEEELRLTAAIGHKVRFPMLKELFSNTIGGNPTLDTERAWVSDIGVDSDGVFVQGLDLSAHAFGNSIRDLIEKYRDVYANIGHAIIAGATVEVRYKPISLLQFYTGYRYLYARDLEHKRPLDYRTPHRVTLGERLYFNLGLTVSLEAVFNSGQHAYYVDAVSGNWKEDALPPFTLMNGHLCYEHKVRSAVLYVTVDGLNLLDIDYSVGSFEPRAGREVMIGIGSRI